MASVQNSFCCCFFVCTSQYTRAQPREGGGGARGGSWARVDEESGAGNGVEEGRKGKGEDVAARAKSGQ